MFDFFLCTLVCPCDFFFFFNLVLFIKKKNRMEFDLNLSVVVYPIIEWVKQYSFPKNLSIQ